MQDSNRIIILFYKKIDEKLHFFLGKSIVSEKYICISEQISKDKIAEIGHIDAAIDVLNKGTLSFLNEGDNSLAKNLINNNSITYNNQENKSIMFVIKYDIPKSKVDTLNNILRFIQKSNLSAFSQFKWMSIDEILNFTDYFDKKFMLNLLKFLNDNSI